MALSNKKVSNCIPNDLVFSVMSKIPLKSLNRFKCVRKSWGLLFESPYFMNMYRKRVISDTSYDDDDTYLFLKKTRLDLEIYSFFYLFSGERFDNKVMLDLPPPFHGDDRDINILGSGINGILCLYVDGFNSEVVVWNPAIEEFKVIPPSSVVSIPPHVGIVDKHHGFGYDCIRDDYKIVRYVDFHPNLCNFLEAWTNMTLSKVLYDPLWEIYSLKSNSWRKLDLDMTTFYRSPVHHPEQVYMNGVCHWLGRSETDTDNLYLVSFDLGNEVFFLTSIPLTMGDNIYFDLVDTHLMMLNESIALMSNNTQTSTFHISILGEIGVKESWTKLFII